MIKHFNGSEYGEKHHILPKSMGGNNSSENITKIPARVHFILHRLLVKMTIGSDKSKMYRALWAMSVPPRKWNNRTYKVTSHVYTIAKSEYSKFMKENNPMFRKDVIERWMTTNTALGWTNASPKGIRRPGQSAVCKRRNEIYWKTRKLPILELVCQECNSNFKTNLTKRMFCSNTCSGKFNNRKRKRSCLDNKEQLPNPSLV